jgi:hypothetical protein
MDVSVSDHWMVVTRGHLGAEVEVQGQQVKTKLSTHLDVPVSDHWMVVSRGHLGAEVEVQLQQDGEVQEHRVHCHAYVILKVTFYSIFLHFITNMTFFNIYTMHCKEDLFYVFPEMNLRGLVLNFHINVL